MRPGGRELVWVTFSVPAELRVIRKRLTRKLVLAARFPGDATLITRTFGPTQRLIKRLFACKTLLATTGSNPASSKTLPVGRVSLAAITAAVPLNPLGGRLVVSHNLELAVTITLFPNDASRHSSVIFQTCIDNTGLNEVTSVTRSYFI